MGFSCVSRMRCFKHKKRKEQLGGPALGLPRTPALRLTHPVLPPCPLCPAAVLGGRPLSGSLPWRGVPPALSTGTSGLGLALLRDSPGAGLGVRGPGTPVINPRGGVEATPGEGPARVLWKSGACTCLGEDTGLGRPVSPALPSLSGFASVFPAPRGLAHWGLECDPTVRGRPPRVTPSVSAIPAGPCWSFRRGASPRACETGSSPPSSA